MELSREAYQTTNRVIVGSACATTRTACRWLRRRSPVMNEQGHRRVAGSSSGAAVYADLKANDKILRDCNSVVTGM
jgi:hypothetical protein